MGRCRSGRSGPPAKWLWGEELHPGFESLPPRLYALVAQWMRASPCGGEGRAFESRRGCSGQGRFPPIAAGTCSLCTSRIACAGNYSGAAPPSFALAPDRSPAQRRRLKSPLLGLRPADRLRGRRRLRPCHSCLRAFAPHSWTARSRRNGARVTALTERRSAAAPLPFALAPDCDPAQRRRLKSPLAGLRPADRLRGRCRLRSCHSWTARSRRNGARVTALTE